MSGGRRGVLYVGFVAAGVGCALPGVLMPLLEGMWGWNDRRAGWLFLVVTAAPAVAPLVLRGRLRGGIGLGHLLAGMGLVGWVIGWPLVSAAAYGFGLGLVMTGVSLRLVRGSEHGNRVLARLNVLWALGAFLCPAMVARALHGGSVRGLLPVMAGAFGVLAVMSWLLVEDAVRGDFRISVGLKGVPGVWVVGAVVATGVEASCGAWMATYGGRTAGGMVTVVACFWAGLLVSRCMASWRALPVGWMATLTAVSAAGVMVARGVPVAAFGLGFGLGPLYPEFLARVLRVRESSGVFFLAGAVSAGMPWATGAISVAAGSLRWGLAVPLAGALVLVVCGWRWNSGWVRPLQRV